MKSILFCQFHNELINGNYEKDITSEYYTGIYKYKENDGYMKTHHFFEIPLWIAEICGSLKGSDYNKKLLIIKNPLEAVKALENMEINYICFSVLEVNKKYIQAVIDNYKGKAIFILGGYINFDSFKKYNNAKIFDNVPNFINFLGLEYHYNLDYSLFKGFDTMPRLTLSTGCLNKCKFCTVDKKLIEKSEADILKQIEAYKVLNFKLIYLNDKTLGQVENYKLLPSLYKRIKRYNPDFKGFIIQTTCNQFLKQDFIDNIKKSNIFACELGIETYNNNILGSLKKPQNTKIIDNAINVLKTLNIKIIPNLIIGLIGETKETYNNTLDFIRKHKKNIYLLNIYNLAIYLNTELGKEIKTKNENDFNENSTKKSFYNNNDLKNNTYFYNNIFNIGLEILKQ